MEHNKKLSRCADIIRNTYIQKDINLRLALFKGKNDPQPKRASTSLSVKFNLVEALVAGAGILALGFTLHRYRLKACEAKVLRKLADECEDVCIEE